MFGRIFRSRWSALFWAGGIIWTAVDVASGTPPPTPATGNVAAPADAMGEPATAADLAVLANAGIN